ncbi:MAG: DUF2892 domain-containing protein [Chryseolinea sp.]
MKKNMGRIDRLARLHIAILIVALFTNGVVTGATGIISLAFAAIFTITSFISLCPLYLPFGLNSFRKNATYSHQN